MGIDYFSYYPKHKFSVAPEHTGPIILLSSSSVTPLCKFYNLCVELTIREELRSKLVQRELDHS